MIIINQYKLDEGILQGFQDLCNEGKRISNMGWVKAISNKNLGSLGLTYEALLGKEMENFEWADYNGVELKSRYKYSDSCISLFNATPDNDFFEIKRIYNAYGYPDRDYAGFKIFKITVTTNHYSFVPSGYRMRLIVDWDKEMVRMVVYDKKFLLIENEISWSFQMLKEKLERKLSYVAFIEADRRWMFGDLYFYYELPKCYRLKDFAHFLHLIECGKIKISFQIGVYKGEYRYGKIYDHGTSFKINTCDFEYLFERLNL